MKVLIVCSRNSGQIAPFIQEQGAALSALGLKVEYCTIEGKGFWGYLKNRKHLLHSITEFKPNLIHAHYGLSGLLANLQREIPVVTTYHGSDINTPKVYPLSRINMMLSAHNIFVSERNLLKSGLKEKYSLIPCGIDIGLFKPMDKEVARQMLNLDKEKKLILFAGSLTNYVKNPHLAKTAVALLPGVVLLELKGYIREQVALLLNAVDVVLMTSFTEGSPQIIKEAMACNCPIVSVAVGDVPNVIADTVGCYLSDYQDADIAAKLQQAFDFGKRTEGRARIIKLGLDSETVAMRVQEVYEEVVSDK